MSSTVFVRHDGVGQSITNQMHVTRTTDEVVQVQLSSVMRVCIRAGAERDTLPLLVNLRMRNRNEGKNSTYPRKKKKQQFPIAADMSAPGDNRVRLVKTAFVIYHHADLAKARQFFLNFGMSIAREHDGKEIYFQGYGVEPIVYIARIAQKESHFGGAAYVVESYAELEKAARIHGATQIAVFEGPGGGEWVTLTDPAGHHVHLIFGQQEKEKQEMKLPKLLVNFEDDKPRKGNFQRFEPGPAPVHRWGHYGVTYPTGTYQMMFDWYTSNLRLAPSDIVYKEGQPSTCFFHIDRASEFTDHHSFFFKPVKDNDDPRVAHSAFEVHDFDVQHLGHDHLTSKGYKLCWGVGRVGLRIHHTKYLQVSNNP